MLIMDDARRMAAGWCDAWNRRDLDTIMAHYAEDVAYRSAGVVERWGLPDGWLHGRSRLRDNFAQALQTPGLHMTLVDVLLGVGSLCVLYRRETGTMVGELMEFNTEGLFYRVVANYGAQPAAVVETVTNVAITTVAVPTVVQVVAAPAVLPPPPAPAPAPTRGTRLDIREFSAESYLPHSRVAVWAALTRPALIARWMLPNDFSPVVGHRFSLRAAPSGEWDGVINAQVLEVEPRARLSYRWLASNEPATRDGIGMGTIVTWTLGDDDRGTLLHMAHAGYHTPQSDAAHRVMSPEWETMFATIGLLARDLER